MINYSKTIVYYDIYLRFMIEYVTDPANVTRLQVGPTVVTDLNTKKGVWDTDMKGYLNPETYGKLNTATINSDYKEFRPLTDALKQTLKNNPAIVLTEKDYLIIDIHKDAKPSASKKPNETPTLLLKTANHLNNEYRVFDIANPTSGAKPKGTKRIKVIMLVQDAGIPAPSLDKLKPEMDSGSMTFDIPFTIDQVGKIAYIAVCFSNDAGDSAYSAIIASPII
ncbi:MAG: hypothetical protein WCP52_00530 [Bacteroidota bacterium]